VVLHSITEKKVYLFARKKQSQMANITTTSSPTNFEEELGRRSPKPPDSSTSMRMKCRWYNRAESEIPEEREFSQLHDYINSRPESVTLPKRADTHHRHSRKATSQGFVQLVPYDAK